MLARGPLQKRNLLVRASWGAPFETHGKAVLPPTWISARF